MLSLKSVVTALALGAALLLSPVAANAIVSHPTSHATHPIKHKKKKHKRGGHHKKTRHHTAAVHTKAGSRLASHTTPHTTRATHTVSAKTKPISAKVTRHHPV